MDLAYCRLCLKLSKNEFSVFDLITISNYGCIELSKMIFVCTNLKITKADSPIHNICDPCINEVIRCYNFRKKCHESYQLLNTNTYEIFKDTNDLEIKLEEGGIIQIPTVDHSYTQNEEIKTELEHSNSVEILLLDNCAAENQSKGCPFREESCSTFENKEIDLKVKEEIGNDGEQTVQDTNPPLKGASFDENEYFSSSPSCPSPTFKVDPKMPVQKQRKLKISQNLKLPKDINNEYKCKICPKHFKNSTLLRLHSETHSDHFNYLCVTCGQGFKSRQNLRAHNVRKHTNLYKCTVCNKTYSANSQLHAHMRVHTGEKPYPCAVCGVSFAQKYSVAIHMRVHTGERPYQCRYCDKTFLMHCHRRDHESNHEEAENTITYTCVVCKKNFRRKDLYKEHLNVHSDERNQKCKLCTKTYKTRRNLVSHIRSVHKVKKKE